MIYDNNNLEKLWTPANTIKVTRGKIFAQSNPRLCPVLIYDLQAKMRQNKGNVSGDVSLQSNGNRVVCKLIKVNHFFQENF